MSAPPHPPHPRPPADPGAATLTALVFVRDRERDVLTPCKTKLPLAGGGFDRSAWTEGAYACDCARGRLVYWNGEFACGRGRFVVERVLAWDTGELLYSETEPG